MSDPNLPEGVTQRDIDATVGETFEPNMCEHWSVKCDNCDLSIDDMESNLKKEIEKVRIDLGRYGKHDDSCVSRDPNPFNYDFLKCNCGLDAALRRRNT